MGILQPNKFTLTLDGGLIRVQYTNGKRDNYFEVSKSLVTKANNNNSLILRRLANNEYIKLSQTLIDGANCNPPIRTDTFNNMYADIMAYFNEVSSSEAILNDILLFIQQVQADTTALANTSYITPAFGVLMSGESKSFAANTIRSLNFSNTGEMLFTIGSETKSLNDMSYMPITAQGAVGLLSEEITLQCNSGYIIYTILQ